jgi:glucose/arabinose dehydrogenase
VVAAAVLATAAAGAVPYRLPAGFEERVLAQGLTSPTAVAVASDGRTFVTEQSGVLKVFLPGRPSEGRIVLDISDHVDARVDLGLVNVALDSRFAATGRAYLLYSRRVPPPYRGAPPAAAGRLARITIRPDGTVADEASPETVVLGRVLRSPCPPAETGADCLPIDGVWHAANGLSVGADATLWVATGDGSTFDYAANIASGAAFRAQDERSLAGKVLHVDGAGRGLPGHPFCRGETNLSLACTKVFAIGFRNPYRLSVAPDGRPVIGDVGENAEEEIDLVDPGSDHGWPCWEGTTRHVIFRASGYCRRYYASPRPTMPFLRYKHFGNAAVVAGPILRANHYPAKLYGKLFFGDYAQRRISWIRGPAEGDAGVPQAFIDGPTPVDLRQAPNGNLVYIDHSFLHRSGRVVELAYTGRRRPPVAAFEASAHAGEVPLRVVFDARGSYDPEGSRLRYRWRWPDGTQSRGRRVRQTFRRTGLQTVRLSVFSRDGRRATAVARLFPGRSSPRVRIRASARSRAFAVGRRITLRGNSHVGDRRLGRRAHHWLVTLHHGTHLHRMTEGRGRAVSFRTLRDHGADSWYEAWLTVRDGPVAVRRRAVLRPRLVGLAISSTPPGAPIDCNTVVCRTPYVGRVAAGQRLYLVAPETVNSFHWTSRLYRFTRWADGAPRARKLIVGAHDIRLHAVYEPAE